MADWTATFGYRRRYAALVAAIAALAGPASAAVVLPAVSVTADPADLAFVEPLRSVTVLTREDLRETPATNLDEVLATVGGVSVRRRGAPGVQSDIGLRGSNFKQTQILIDGVPVQNPQAAHLSSNLPIPLSAVQRIEVIKGPGAVQYGGGGTGGVINIITRRADRPEARLELVGGSHATRQLHAAVGGGNDRFSSLLSANVSHSDSETSRRPNDADVQQLLYTGDARLEALHLKVGLATSHKKFGAWGFYSDVAPDAREETRSRMAWLDAALPLADWTAHARTYWMRQEDDFLTRIGSQGFLNQHRTDVGGLEGDLKHEDPWGTTVVGGKFRHEALESSALGGHRRNETSVWVFRRQQLTDQLSAGLGLSWVNYQHDQSYWLPSVALGWQVSPQWRAYASWARSARVPNFTELYLDTAANRGNPELGVERSRYYELGLNGNFQHQQVEVAVYQRHTSGFIDFTRQPGAFRFQAHNLQRFRATGADMDWRWYPDWRWLDQVRLGYGRMQVDIGGGAAKNSSHLPWQTFRAGLRAPLPRHLSLAVDARRPSYHGQSTATLVGARLAWKYQSVHAYLDVQNLLDKDVIEAGFAPIAGRWVTVGVGWRL